MRSVNHIVILLLLTLVLLPSYARCGQRYPAHNELWTRAYLIHNFSPKFRIESEYQYRWQNNSVEGTNLPSYKLAQGVRIWLYSKINPHFTASISPFCWFRGYPLINTPSDFSKSYSNELRASAGAECKFLLNNIEFKSRLIYETRFLCFQGSDEWLRKDRVRARAIVSVPILTDSAYSSSLIAFAGNEYFFQGEQAFTNNSEFDQNRIIGGFSWTVNNHLKFDAYYMHILKNGTIGNFIERVIWLNTSFTL